VFPVGHAIVVRLVKHRGVHASVPPTIFGQQAASAGPTLLEGAAHRRLVRLAVVREEEGRGLSVREAVERKASRREEAVGGACFDHGYASHVEDFFVASERHVGSLSRAWYPQKMLEILQEGSGAERPVILLYMAGTGNMGPTLAALVPEAFVLSEKGNFEAPNPFHNGFSTWQDALSFAESFGFKASHLWLVGFSAGCWLVREQLRSGAPATVTLAADGIHMALQETEQTLQEQQPWMTLVQEAIQEKSVFFVSVSATPATYSKDTRTTAERLFSWVRCMGSYENPCITSEGYFR